MPYHCRNCPAGGGMCADCRSRSTGAQALRRKVRRDMIENPEQRARRRACAVIAHAMSGPLADPWLLQEDGEYDLGAVRVATEGTRRVRLTLTERIAAATAILLRAGTARQVCEHLSLPRVVRG